MKRPVYVARKSFTVGDRVVEPGDPVPEANGWRHVDNWVNQGFLVIERYEEEGSAPAPAPAPDAEPEPDPDPEPEAVPLDDLTVPELREIARERDLSGYSKLTRDELLDLLAD